VPIPDAPDLIRTVVAHFVIYAARRHLLLPQALQIQSLDKLRDPDLIGELISRQIQDPGRVADIIAPVMEVPVADKQGVLATLDPLARLERVDALLLSDQKSRLKG
jgi:ATP-dependent Lon protease